MEESKIPPWLVESLEGKFFNLTKNEIEAAFEFRENIDSQLGERINEKIVFSNDWVVGCVLESVDFDVFCIAKRYLEEQKKTTNGTLIAIPAKLSEEESLGNSIIFDRFNPPLVAKISSQIEDLSIINGGLVQLISGKYFVFPENQSSVMLINNGKYILFAGCEQLIKNILAADHVSSWRDLILKNDQIDPLIFDVLYKAMTAYKVDARL